MPAPTQRDLTLAYWGRRLNYRISTPVPRPDVADLGRGGARIFQYNVGTGLYFTNVLCKIMIRRLDVTLRRIASL